MHFNINAQLRMMALGQGLCFIRMLFTGEGQALALFSDTGSRQTQRGREAPYRIHLLASFSGAVFQKIIRDNRRQGRTSPPSSSSRTPDGTDPFPQTNLGGVNVDSVEVGCHQRPQHEEEADEAGTR